MINYDNTSGIYWNGFRRWKYLFHRWVQWKRYHRFFIECFHAVTYFNRHKLYRPKARSPHQCLNHFSCNKLFTGENKGKKTAVASECRKNLKRAHEGFKSMACIQAEADSRFYTSYSFSSLLCICLRYPLLKHTCHFLQGYNKSENH